MRIAATRTTTETTFYLFHIMTINSKKRNTLLVKKNKQMSDLVGIIQWYDGVDAVDMNTALFFSFGYTSACFSFNASLASASFTRRRYSLYLIFCGTMSFRKFSRS